MSIEQHSRLGQRGFTLMEMLVASGLGTIVMAVVAVFSYYGAFSLACVVNYAQMDSASESTANQLTRDARRANKVTSYTTNSLVLEDFDGVALTYAYDPSQGTLTRTKNGTSTVLLKQCDAFTFTLGKRNPGGAFENFPSGTAAECKVIDAAWQCSRTLFGRKATSANLASAKVVIRRQ